MKRLRRVHPLYYLALVLFIAAVVCGLLVIPVGKMMRGVPAGDR